MLDRMAAEIRRSFEAHDVAGFGAFLADDVRWGDDEAPNQCRNSAEVVATFERLLAEGVDGELAEIQVGSSGILCRLRIRRPGVEQDAVQGTSVGAIEARREVLHLYRVRDGKITQIRPFADTAAAEAQAELRSY
ncbi:MAG: nuclear transport factor 2 family protein [Acidimicrobiales bacterium]